jgi:hypothetical protein
MSTTHTICLRAKSLAAIALGFLLGAAACSNLRAQGVLQFENMSGAVHRAPVYNTDTCQCAKNGNSVSGIPSGGQTYTGALLSGPGFTMELWAAPANAPDSALAPVARTTFGTGISAGFIFPVYVSSPVAVAGATLKCQARAWNNMSGTLTSWNQAQCAGTQAGSYPIFTAGPIPASGTILTTSLRSFCLVQAEPALQVLFLMITRNGNTTVLDRFGVNHLLTGDDVQISATGPALQSPSMRLQWRQNGQDLTGATNVTLDLTFVEVSQTGNYSLLATDGACSHEIPFQLEVHPPPSLRQPQVDAQGKFHVTVVSAPFRSVTVETATRFAAWSDASTVTADAAGNFEFSQTFPASPSGRFLRARVGP